MNKAEELIIRYNLQPDSYYPDNFNPYKDYTEKDKLLDKESLSNLKSKYQRYVPPRWYGFNGLGYPTPLIWYDVLDEFLAYVEEKCPEFEIYQIKIKFGGIRIYIGNISDEIQQEIYQLTSAMVDAKLIY